MESFKNWFLQQEHIDSTRYSIETNYRTKMDETLAAYAKITLGYASAAMKKLGFHVKQVYEVKPIRMLVSSRNWDDGEWVGMVSWNPEHKCFVISKGFYNKDRQTISVQSSGKCSADSASEIVRELRNVMHTLRGTPDRHVMKLKKVPLKRGPK